jgi:HSP20 family protein
MSWSNDSLKDLTSLQDRMNRLFSESVKRLKEMSEPPGEGFRPPVDIHEFEDRFVIMADLPGAPKEEVSVEIEGGALVIRGRRPLPDGLDDGALFRSERRFGRFERRFNLPGGAVADHITAKMTDGVLTVTITKEDPSAHRVKVDIG